MALPGGLYLLRGLPGMRRQRWLEAGRTEPADGHAGAAATYFCLRCMARLNQTNIAGVRHLRVLPEPWKSADEAALRLSSPPMRTNTDAILAQAKAYALAWTPPVLRLQRHSRCGHRPPEAATAARGAAQLLPAPLYSTVGQGVTPCARSAKVEPSRNLRGPVVHPAAPMVLCAARATVYRCHRTH